LGEGWQEWLYAGLQCRLERLSETQSCRGGIAEQSRRVMFELLREAAIISAFEKEPGFDRLFPNQDLHSGKGLGNLIALPLNGNSLENGNSAFLNPETFEPFNNQFDVLAGFQKLKKETFQQLYKNLFEEKPRESLT
jgi:hypothetical protein